MEEASPRSRAKAEQIRRAAQKLFLAHGVGATSMDAITAEAGVSKQTVYAYFPSKGALLTEVLNALVAERAAPWAEAQAAEQDALATWADLEEELATMALQIIRSLMDEEYLATARVVIAEAGTSPEYGDLFRRSVAEPILKAVNATLRRANRDGLLADAPHEDIARLLVGSLLTFFLLDGLLKPDDIKRPSSRRVRRLVSVFVSAVQASAGDRVAT